MDIDNITDIRAQSSGIIEVGWVTLYVDGKELQFDIEEHSIRGGYDFKVYVAFGTDISMFDIKVDEETHMVLDEEFIDFIRDQYTQLSTQ